MAVTPAIVIKSEFTYSDSNRSFNGYLDYINREDAKENKQIKRDKKSYAKYLDYVEDGRKNGQLFDEHENFISKERRENILNQYRQAEKIGSPLWKDVISFDNGWLEEQGLYNPKTHWLNEDRMKNVVRDAMDALIESEKMRMPIWTASFHYNTDNIHVHIATVELDPSHLEKVQAKDPKNKKPLFDDMGDPIMQYRGKRKQGTLKKMRSTVANRIIDRSPAYKRIDELIRDNARRVKEMDLHKNKQTKKLLEKAMENMPRDLKQWRYGYHAVDGARPYIDKIAELYLETYHKEDMNELIRELDEQVALSEQIYGADSNASQYKDNKLDDLKQRLGNAVISQMKTYYREPFQMFETNGLRINTGIQLKIKKGIRNGKYHYNFRPLNEASRDMNRAVYLLNKAMHKTFHEYETERNIAEFDRMMDGYER